MTTSRRAPAARKRLAVPYRAADTPSERSEWAQPEVALLLTHLAYYHDGLSLEQFSQALAVLMSMGRNAQADYYKEWLNLAGCGRIDPGGWCIVSCYQLPIKTYEDMDGMVWGWVRGGLKLR